MVQVIWEENVFRTGILLNLKQFSRQISIELVGCGQCSSISVPAYPTVEAAPLDEQRRGFEVIVKR